MQREELLRRLGDLEDNFTERKRDGANRADLRRTLVAFANSVPEGREAVLWIGVADDGTPLGVENPDALQRTVREIAEEVCYPPVRYSAEAIEVEGNPILAIVIGPSPSRPHFSGPAYVRKGSESVLASAELYEELIATRNSKAGAILANKGAIVTVIAHKILGSTKRVGDSRYRARHECRILGCDAHVLYLEDLRDDTRLSEPLEKVTIRYDHEADRMMLEVVE